MAIIESTLPESIIHASISPGLTVADASRCRVVCVVPDHLYRDYSSLFGLEFQVWFAQVREDPAGHPMPAGPWRDQPTCPKTGWPSPRWLALPRTS